MSGALVRSTVCARAGASNAKTAIIRRILVASFRGRRRGRGLDGEHYSFVRRQVFLRRRLNLRGRNVQHTVHFGIDQRGVAIRDFILPQLLRAAIASSATA